MAPRAAAPHRSRQARSPVVPRLATLVLCLAVAAAAAGPSIRLEEGVFRLEGWSGAAALEPDRHPEVFQVYVDRAISGLPPLGGRYRVAGGALLFEPRYPLEPGLRYRAVFQPPEGGQPVEAFFEIPRRQVEPTTVVDHIYPSTDRLPENQLKFYLHFSASMSRGEAYQHVHLLDEAGNKISLPFLELDQELWDRDYRRLMILFDPGRVKRGLLPHEEAGVPIEEGNSYTLVVDSAWRDARGIPLKQAYRKPFRVGPPDREPPSITTWRLTPPETGADAVTLDFPEPLDAALLLRLIGVEDQRGRPVAGTPRLDRNETRWEFLPDAPWQPGRYRIAVGTTLEDLAGNSLDRPFEVDLFEKVEERIHRETQYLEFTIGR
jgi:hypothetical protein